MAYCKQVIVISDRPSVANCMKLAINYNVVSTIELIGETYVFAEKCGIPLEYLRDFDQNVVRASWSEDVRGSCAPAILLAAVVSL